MDKYYKYRPLLDLLGKSEGTDKGRGYNETLGYGAYTNGPVDLTKLNLTEIDILQTKMLNHPKNKLNSSAVGRYQIVRTTLRAMRANLGLDSKLLFNEELQDRLACYLIGARGIDDYLEGKLSEDALLLNLAREWASLPMANGKGYYAGQRASVPVSEVRAVLKEVRNRRSPAAAPKPTVPTKEDSDAKGLGYWIRLILSVLFGGKK